MRKLRHRDGKKTTTIEPGFEPRLSVPQSDKMNTYVHGSYGDIPFKSLFMDGSAIQLEECGPGCCVQQISASVALSCPPEVTSFLWGA